MTKETKGSRRLFREFVKEKGFLAFRKKKKDDPDKDEAKSKTTEVAPEKPKDSKSSDTAKAEEKKSPWPYVARLVREFKGQKSRLLLILCMSVVANIMGAAFPWSSKFMIDSILPQRNVHLLIAFCALLLLIAVCDVILKNLQDYISNTIGGNFTVHIKRRLMKQLQSLPLVRIQELKVGGIISRLQQDTESMSSLLFDAVISPFNAILMFCIALTSLFLLSWRVTIVCIIFSLIIAGVAYFVFNVMRPFQKTLREDNSTISAQLTEAFGGVKVVRSFCRENTIKRDYALGIDLLWRKSLYGNVVSMLTHRSLWMLYYLLLIFIWLFGGYNVIKGQMTIGGVVVFITFMEWLFAPVFRIMFSFSRIQQSLACTERAFDLLDEKPDIVDKDDAYHIKTIEKQIEFHDVTFKYPDGTTALTNVSLKIPKGKVTALVGPSGSGKTTLTNLVLRFYDVTEGKITIDSRDICDLKLGPYRRLLSLVLQEVFLFDGTVFENIAFGRPEASMEEVQKVAKIAHCHEFIEELEKKYDTIIGERGVKLSGGQKQRIALARALLTDPELLILDEATSNLDSESESLIQEALKEIFKHRTSIVIAHRLSTIMDADNIIVIDEGKVVEQGSHDQLLKKKGRYSEMYNKQMEKVKMMQNYWNDSSKEPDK